MTHISRGIKTSAKGASNPDSANHHPTSKYFENSPEYFDDKNKKIRGISGRIEKNLLSTNYLLLFIVLSLLSCTFYPVLHTAYYLSSLLSNSHTKNYSNL